MAKIMFVRCNPLSVKFIESKKKHHIVTVKSDDEAFEVLGRISPHLLPDLVIIGNFPPFDRSKREAKRLMIDFARSIKRRFRMARIVLANGRIFPRRAPAFATGVCRASPEAVLAAIQQILSPTS